MVTLKTLLVSIAGAAFVTLVAGELVSAATISADTTGEDNFTDSSFYGVTFTSGSTDEFVSSVSYNLSRVSRAFFDFDGDFSFENSMAPVLDASSLVGLTADNISFDFDGLRPKLLTINFASGSFGLGDTFRFAADTDFLVSAPAPGEVFGIADIPFSVRLENGFFGSAKFAQVSSTRSEATVTPVPEPASEFGTLMFGALGAGLLLKHTQQQKA